jgi:class 3 adenylate cyclase
VRFATARDGVRVAYAVHGEGPPLVFVRGWVSHLDMLWERATFRAYFEALGERFRVVRYDLRGNGLSDREVGKLTLADLALDIEAVVAALDLDSFVLYASSFGGPLAIAYAAAHPARVSRLVLDGTYARGAEIAPPDRLKTIVQMFRAMPEVAAAAMRSATNPDKTDDVFRRSQEGWRAVTNEVAANLYELGFGLDVTDLLPKVVVPALVLHRRGSRSFGFELGRRLAAELPDARFVALEGQAQEPWEGDPRPGLAAIGEFLGVELRLPGEVRSRAEKDAPLVVLFTDLADSTSLTQRVGDDAAQEVVRAHNAIVRAALAETRGTEIKHTGDGIMASFVSPSRALACAVAIQEGVRRESEAAPSRPFEVRIGINAGEPVEEEGDLFGAAVQLAARICKEAAPGQVVVSRVVRELSAGKRFAFADLGERRLKGFAEPVRLYELKWSRGGETAEDPPASVLSPPPSARTPSRRPGRARRPR